MWPYFSLIIIPYLVYYLFLSISKKKNAVHWSISSFFLIWLFLLMFRHESIGIDIENYHNMYDNLSYQTIKEIIYSFDIEKGYSIWNKLCYLIYNDFQVFLALTALFCIIPIWVFYYKRTENALFTIALFLIIAPFTMYFSGLRQSMAMSFVFPAFVFVRDKKILPFALITLLAFTFHQSALIMLLLYPLYYLRLNRVGVFLITLFAVLSFIGARYVFSFSQLFFGERYEERYGAMDDNGAFGMFVLLFVFFVYCNNVLDYEKLGSEFKALRNILAFTVIVQALASVNLIIMRINYYFLPLLPILFAQTSINPIKNYKSIVEIATVIISAFFTCRFVISIYNGTLYDTDILQVFPWISCWK